MNEKQVLALLHKRLEGRKQAELAQELGISTAYLSAVLTHKKPPRGKLLAYLGFKANRVTTYIYTEVG